MRDLVPQGRAAIGVMPRIARHARPAKGPCRLPRRARRPERRTETGKSVCTTAPGAGRRPK